jgi:hypothetical protein
MKNFEVVSVSVKLGFKHQSDRIALIWSPRSFSASRFLVVSRRTSCKDGIGPSADDGVVILSEDGVVWPSAG